MNHQTRTQNQNPVEVFNKDGGSPIVLVCEHASARFPDAFGKLGLAGEALQSHVAWDPGALGLAQHLSSSLDAVLVASCVSRLVYDCNRPPEAPDAMPARSETVDVPGNVDLSDADKSARVAEVYEPFRATIARTLGARRQPILVTVHSFTPVFHGEVRDVEIGILHDEDARLADAILTAVGDDMLYLVERNAPYGPEHGVTHTLKEHALPGGFLNVMIEVRNDLIPDDGAQAVMADVLAGWLREAIADLEADAWKV